MYVKLGGVLSAALLLLALSLPGAAANADDAVITQDSASGDVKTLVTYDVGETYQLSIPARVDLSEGAASASIAATAVNLFPSHKLCVKLADGVEDGAVKLVDKTDQDRFVTSTVSLSKSGAGLSKGETVATFANGSTASTSGGTLYFSALPTSVGAGSYAGTITFSIAITDA